MTHRSINDAGLELIKKFEGLRLEAYECSASKWTIGWGHTRTAKPGMKITTRQAEALLDADLKVFEAGVARAVKVPLTENQFAALVSFAFNVGLEAFEKSTLRRLLNRGWHGQVPAQFMRWNKVDGKELAGLTRRRRAEAELWKTA